MSLTRVLIVDDDVNICQLLTIYLEKEGYSIDVAHNGMDAIGMVRSNAYNVILLDIMMPVMDGFETLKELRSFSDTPVILVSAKGEAMDKISGLDFGADDYVTKPFEPQELISRIKALLRRTQSGSETQSDLIIGNLFISISNYIVKIGGTKVDMPPREIELLHFLAVHPMRVYTREQLLEQVWDSDYKGDSRTVDVHIKRIREKLGDEHSWRLVTVWGVGYKFEVS